MISPPGWLTGTLYTVTLPTVGFGPGGIAAVYFAESARYSLIET